MSQVIPFPKPEVLDITNMPLSHVSLYCKTNGWSGFQMRRYINEAFEDRLEIRRTYVAETIQFKRNEHE